MSNQEIICRELPTCPVCRRKGQQVYTGLIDTLFDTKGTWFMDTCTNKQCGTYWLNPTPLASELVKLYDNYTTHSTPALVVQQNRTIIRLVFESIRSAVHAEYGYKSSIPAYLQPALRAIAKLHPGWRDSQLNQLLYVPFVENGYLLDVGCGNGNAMTRFKDRGFNVAGTDFDNKAIEEAKSKGLDVYLGDLKEISFKDNTYDVVFLSHVIEHVPNPIEFLAECYRILKPGGQLIALTPNANSRSHKKFKEHWRGLEVPRHLQIFTPNSLASAATKAGFSKVIGKTCMQGVFYLRDASKAHKITGSFELPPQTKTKKLLDQVRLFTEGLHFSLAKGGEETILLKCQK